MGKQFYLQTFSSIAVILFVFLAGCNSTALMNTATPIIDSSRAVSSRNAMETVEMTQVIVPENHATSTFESLKVATKPLINSRNTTAPVRTPTFYPTPSSTLYPTLSIDNITRLVESNGNCIFPCWLGITPGRTIWKTAYPYILSFAEEINTLPSSISSEVYGVIIRLPDKKVGATITVRKGVVDHISTKVDITLRELITTYGSPTEIYLNVINWDTQSPDGRFTMALFYKEKGILAIYTGSFTKSEKVEICVSLEIPSEHIWVFWDPNKIYSFVDVGKEAHLIDKNTMPDREFPKLPEISSYNAATFSEAVRANDDRDLCLFVASEK